MSILTELHDKINEGVTNVEGWVQEVRDHLPAVAAAAQKYENSPIVKALENAVLPPEVEQQIADLISKLAAEFPVATDTTVPAAANTDTTAAPA